MLTHHGLVTSYGNTDQGQPLPSNGLLPDGTNLPEPILTYHWYDPVKFVKGQFQKNLENRFPKMSFKSLTANELRRAGSFSYTISHNRPRQLSENSNQSSKPIYICFRETQGIDFRKRIAGKQHEC